MDQAEIERAVRLDRLAPYIVAITIDRPAARNTLTLAMCERIGELTADCEADDDVRVVVLRGTGKFFCSGADMRSVDMKGQPGGLPPVRFERYFITRLLKLTKPLIAQIGGPAAGGGLGMALACDLRLCADDAIFATSFLRIGVIAHDMTTWLLPRIIGISRTFELLYRPGRVSAERALEIGLVSEMHPAAELEERTLSLALEIAALAPHAVRLSKNLIMQGLQNDAEEHVVMQEFAAMSNRLVAPHDIAEGSAAFIEKRPPKFRGAGGGTP